jgi:hypothetical protein
MLQYIQLRSDYFDDVVADSDVGGLVVGPPLSLSLSLSACSELTHMLCTGCYTTCNFKSDYPDAVVAVVTCDEVVVVPLTPLQSEVTHILEHRMAMVHATLAPTTQYSGV